MHYWKTQPRWTDSKNQKCFLCGSSLPDEEETVRQLVTLTDQPNEDSTPLLEVDPTRVRIDSVDRGWEGSDNIAIVKLSAVEGEISLTISLEMDQVVKLARQLDAICGGLETFEEN